MTQLPPQPQMTPADAKAELLAWAEATDARAAASSGMIGTAVKTGLVVLAGVLLAKALLGLRRAKPESNVGGTHVIHAALVVKAATWLLPRALRWIRTATKPASAADTSANKPEGALRSSTA